MALKPLRQPLKVVQAMLYQISTMVVPSSKIVVSLLLKNFNYFSIYPFVYATYTLRLYYAYAMWFVDFSVNKTKRLLRIIHIQAKRFHGAEAVTSAVNDAVDFFVVKTRNIVFFKNFDCWF